MEEYTPGQHLDSLIEKKNQELREIGQIRNFRGFNIKGISPFLNGKFNTEWIAFFFNAISRLDPADTPNDAAPLMHFLYDNINSYAGGHKVPQEELLTSIQGFIQTYSDNSYFDSEITKKRILEWTYKLLNVNYSSATELTFEDIIDPSKLNLLLQKLKENNHINDDNKWISKTRSTNLAALYDFLKNGYFNNKKPSTEATYKLMVSFFNPGITISAIKKAAKDKYMATQAMLQEYKLTLK